MSLTFFPWYTRHSFPNFPGRTARMKLKFPSASTFLLLLVPPAVFADVSNGFVLQANNALNLDTGTKVAAGSGDILWTGSNLVPQGSATAVTLGALGINPYKALTEAD